MYEVLRHVSGYQHRIDDQREMLAPFIAAMISVHLPKNKRVKPTDLFDRKKKEKRQGSNITNLAEVREQQQQARERAAQRPMPKKLQQMLEAKKKEGGGSP